MQDWVKHETAKQSMGDIRLNKRVAQLLDKLSENPSKSISCSTSTWAETFAAYRLFDNEKASFDSIMSGHQAATIERIRQEAVVLVPQDTTFLNFATDAKGKDMGTLRVKHSDQQLLHTSIAITPQRVNLGIVEGTMWQRPEEKPDQTRACLPIEQKESYRWISHYQRACDIQQSSSETTVVSIADREGDIHEWFQYAQEVPEESRASYIIRAKANRSLDVDEEEPKALWDYMSGQKRIDTYRVNVPKRNGKPGREACIDVSTSEVTLCGKGKNRRPLSLYVVYAKEKNPPQNMKGIEWMLLTDLQVDDAVQARMIIDWYRCRWEIETYFRVVKGGCDIEKSRLQTEARKLNCIAIYMIISWRLHSITMLSRRDSERSCSEVFSEQEWKILWRMQNKCDPPKVPPSVYEMTRLLAMQGGFLARKGDGEPGVKNIWRGYNKLLHYIEAAQTLGL